MQNRKLVIALGLFLLTWLVYLPVRTHPFITYDDPDYVTNNQQVQQGLTVEGVKWAFGRIHGQGTYWHPLTWISHMLDYQLFGLNPGPHHLVSLLVHSLNVVLLFLVLKQFTGTLWQSGMVAALFALHPLQVDTVAWAAERKNLLSGLFWLLSMWAYGAYAKRQVRRGWFYGLAFVLFAFGIMCKPILVTWPCAMLLMDFWPLKRFGWRGDQPVLFREWKTILTGALRLIPEKLPFLLLALVSSVVTFQSHKEMGMTEIHGLPLWLRYENAFVSYARYLRKTLWPNDLAVLYPHPGEWPELAVLISLLLLFLITAAVISTIRRRPYLAVGWFWFLGVLVPAIGVIQVGAQAMADRFAYLPIIGLLITVVWLGQEFLRTRFWRTGLAIAILGASALATSRQLAYWKDSVTLYEHTLAVTERNYLILNNLGHDLAARDQFDEAEKYLREAVRIQGDFAEAHYQLAAILERKKNYDEAVVEYQSAAQFRPDWPLPIAGLGNIYRTQQKTNEAIEAYHKGMQVAPQAAIFPFQIATILSDQGKLAESLDAYRAALHLSPDWPELLNNLAWIYATCPQPEIRNGPEAVRLAEHACKLTHRREAVFIGTLAAAYAEAGRFDEAEQTATEAIQVATGQGRQDLVDANKKLLAGYQKKLPCRQGL